MEINVKSKRGKMEDHEEESPGKNLLCSNLDQYSAKKKVFWLKNGRFY